MCIIAYLTLNKRVYLAKNRDRYYITPIQVFRDVINEVEVLYLVDQKTGWVEGINEYGISIVNSVLPAGAEETFTKYSPKVNTETSWKKEKPGNKDGDIILQALCQSRIEDALSVLISCNCYTNRKAPSNLTTGLNGHTIVSNGKHTYSIENVTKSRPVVREITRRCVRTNTPVYLPIAKGGYDPVTNQLGFISSKARYTQAKKLVSKINKKTQILPSLATINYDDPCNSTYRIGHRCDDKYKYGFATTTQILFDIDRLQMTLHVDKYNTDYLGFTDNINSNDAKTKFNVTEINRPEYPETTLQLRKTI